MPYVRRTVDCGSVKEVKKMFTTRVHTGGTKRAAHIGETSARQKAINERRAEEELRWQLNANYSCGDYHLVLHYYDKEITLEYAELTLNKFIRSLGSMMCARGDQWKLIACTETKRMTNVHHHVIIPQTDLAEIQKIWRKIVGGMGNVSLKPLDDRGQHGKLANYLMKETRRTMERYRELGRRVNRFKRSRGLEKPEVRYEIIMANSWAKEPRPRKGSYLYKFDDGETYRFGVSESGWAWQEYFEIYPATKAVRTQKRRPRNEHKQIVPRDTGQQ